IGGQARRRIAAIKASTGVVTAWNPDADSTVWAIAVDGRKVYAGGYFNTAGGLTRHRIAAFDATTGLATAWNPNASRHVITPSVGGNAGTVTATVLGSALVSGTSIRLTRAAQPSIAGTSVVTVADGSTLTATFDLNGAATGAWNVAALAPDGQSATLANGF